MVRKTAAELRKVIEDISEAVGTPHDNAAVLASILVGSHLAGHDSHGIQHFPRYIREVQAGDIIPTSNPEIIEETSSTALVRGNWGWGHVTAEFVTRLGIKKARENKVALISSVETNHIGRVGEYVERAAAEGVVAIVVLGGFSEELPTAAPHGGSRALLAPNPIAIGFPTAGSDPVVIDFATTEIAGGKVLLAEAKGEEVPPGCLIDSQGHPTTNPELWLKGGALLPFGGHKGFGIMVATEILGRIFSGASGYSDSPHGGVSRHVGLTMIGIDGGAFSSSARFAEGTTELVRRIRAVPPAPGFTEVMAPGDFESNIRNQRLKEGIQIPGSTWEQVVETGRSLGLSI